MTCLKKHNDYMLLISVTLTYSHLAYNAYYMTLMHQPTILLTFFVGFFFGYKISQIVTILQWPDKRLEGIPSKIFL